MRTIDIYKAVILFVVLLFATMIYGKTHTLVNGNDDYCEGTTFVEPQWQTSDKAVSTVSVFNESIAWWSFPEVNYRRSEDISTSKDVDIAVPTAILAEGSQRADFDDYRLREHDSQQSLITYQSSKLDVNEWISRTKLGTTDQWRRRITCINTSDEQIDITGVKFTFFVNAEGEVWDNDNFCMADTVCGYRFTVGYRSTDEYNSISASRDKDGCKIEIDVHTGWRLEPGQQATIGEAVFAVKKTGKDESFKDTAVWWFTDVLRLKRPDYPDWLRGSVMYEAAASGHIDSSFSDTGGFDNFAKQVPYLADLGINFLWLNSVFKHKVESPNKGWNHYDPLDFTKIDEILGGEDGLRRLMGVLNENGFNTVGELVPHGGQSVQALELKEQWATRSPEGEIVPRWNALHIDYSSPPWQEAMGKAAAMLADFGMKGVRIDVADPVSMNWGSPRTNHAAFSQLGGALELHQRIYDYMEQAGVEKPLLIPESCFDRPEFSELSMLGYGWSFIFTLHNIIEGYRESPALLVDELKQAITDKLDSSPPGFLVIWSVGNHDMINYYGRPAIRFGRGFFRALYGMCASLPGIPMLYHEDEIGSYDSIRNINWARRTLPEFKTDHYSLEAVSFDKEGNRVLPILRTQDKVISTESNSTLVLVNFSGDYIHDSVEFKGYENLNMAREVNVYDVLTGDKFIMSDGKFDYSLAAYQTAFLRISKEPVKFPEEKFLGQQPVKDVYSAEFEVEVIDDNTHIQNGNITAVLNVGKGSTHSTPDELSVRYDGKEALTLLVFNSDRWKVSAVDSLISDRTLRRHFPFNADTNYKWDRFSGRGYKYIYNNVSPVGRLWQSFAEPLHPDEPAIVFYDKKGKGIRIEVRSTNAENIVLTDRSDDFPNEPFALELRFYLKDPDMSNRARAFGLRPAFEIEPMPQKEFDEMLNVELKITAAKLSTESFDAKRVSNLQFYTPMLLIGDGFDVPVGPIRFEKEGTVLWPKLSAPAGKYYIEFEAVYSSQSADSQELADSYQICFNDKPLSSKWDRFNADRTFRESMYYFGIIRTEPVTIEQGQDFKVSFYASRGRCSVKKPFKLIKCDD